jgi:hypothetical protein
VNVGAMMRRTGINRTGLFVVLAATYVLGGAAARADSTTLMQWFLHATAAQSSGTAQTLSKPDFLPGTSQRSMACRYVEGGPAMGTWQLQKYDRTHRIGMAAATTDACAVSVFRASKPSVSVPDADLSKFATGRGLHVGSTYQQVLSTYGGKAMHGAHFVARYAATVPGETVSEPPKHIDLPETITLVIDDGHVSAITIDIDLGGEF